MSEDEKNLIRDLVKTPAWELISKLNLDSARSYRDLATQEPGQVKEELRTWFSGKAAGLNEFESNILDLIK